MRSCGESSGQSRSSGSRDTLGIMSDLRDLYQEVIFDHHKAPRNFRKLPDADRSAEGYNPLCGDRITVYLRTEGGRIAEVAFLGSGCAISRASASMMTEAVKGLSLDDSAALFERFHQLVTKGAGAGSDPAAMGKLAAFSGISEFPVRVKCATLPWHTLQAALDGKADPVSTERDEGA